MNRTRSIAQRLLRSATLWILAPLIFGGVVISHYLQDPIIETLDRQIEGDLIQLVEFTKFSSLGEIKAFKTYYEDRKFNRVNSGWYWQIVRAEDQVIVGRSLSMKGFTIPYFKYPNDNFPALLVGAGPFNTDLKVLQRSIKDRKTGRVFRFLVAADPKFVIDAVDKVNHRIAMAFGLMAIALLIGILFQVKFGLKPLKKLKYTLEEIRAGKAEKFDDTYPAEVKPLTDELNIHLQHTEDILSKARAEVGNLAHALKTPISVIGNENRKPTNQNQKIIQAEIEKVERHINSYLLRENETYRRPLISEATDVLSVTRSLSNAIEKQYAYRQINIHVDFKGSHIFKGSRNDLEEMLGNLLENAGKYSSENIWITVEVSDISKTPRPMLTITIDDDGPGVPEAIRETMFSRGKRYDETVPGSGFGLAIVKQISTLYGGSIQLEDSPRGGLRALLSLPRGQQV